MKLHYAHRLSGGRIAQIIGLFVLVPLLGLVVAGVFKAKAEHVFEEKYRLHAMVRHSHGLVLGAAVLVSGIPIGKVDAVEFTEDGTIDVTLLLLKKFQDRVREDSVASVTSSGLFVGQPQVEIAMGSHSKPILDDGATIRTVEPRDLGELVTEVRPVLDTFQRTLLRVDEITKDIHARVQTTGQAMAEIEQGTRLLPEVMASAQRAVGSVERTTAALPELVESAKKTLATMEAATSDVRTATRKLPGLVESMQDAANNVKSTTRSLRGISKDLVPIIQGASETLDDVSTIVRGAKKTFPVSSFVKNAEPKAPSRPESGLRSLRGDQLGR